MAVAMEAVARAAVVMEAARAEAATVVEVRVVVASGVVETEVVAMATAYSIRLRFSHQPPVMGNQALAFSQAAAQGS